MDVTLYDETAEQALLSVMLTNDDACTLAATVRPEDFWHPGLRRVCAAILDLQARGAAIDTVTVSAACPRDRDLIAHLATLIEPVAGHVGDYLQAIAASAAKRRLLRAAQAIESAVHSTNGDVAGLLGTAENIVADAVAEARMQMAMEAPQSTEWLTGAELAAMTPEEPDYVLRPYLARGLIVQLTGKVKGGKTTLAMHMAAAVLHERPFLVAP